MDLSREFREKTNTLATVDVVELDVLYRDLPPYQSESANDFAAAEETRATLRFTEPIVFPSNLLVR